MEWSGGRLGSIIGQIVAGDDDGRNAGGGGAAAQRLLEEVDLGADVALEVARVQHAGAAHGEVHAAGQKPAAAAPTQLSVRTRPSEKRPVGRRGKYHACVRSLPKFPRFPVSAYESPNTHSGLSPLPLGQPPLPAAAVESSGAAAAATSTTRPEEQRRRTTIAMVIVQVDRRRHVMLSSMLIPKSTSIDLTAAGVV
uniref:Uncharacterized protein n=1 Tax=Leersia perrieri TaxID=77586 RepID=A0A0D9XGY3_9ORYZ